MTGCWIVRLLHQLKAPTTINFGISISFISVLRVALRNLSLLIKLIGA